MRVIRKLQREKKRKLDALKANKAETADLQRKGKTIRDDISSLDKQIDLELNAVENKCLEVSDHAIVRYLERVVGFDIETIKREIRGTIKKVDGFTDFEDFEYHKDGFKYVVKGHNVITVTPKPVVKVCRQQKKREWK